MYAGKLAAFSARFPSRRLCTSCPEEALRLLIISFPLPTIAIATMPSTLASQTELPVTTTKPLPIATATNDLLSIADKHITKGLGRMRDHVFKEGKGLRVLTTVSGHLDPTDLQDGQKLLDFSAGIGVTSLGHSHPDVVAAIIAQAQSITHVQCAIALSEPYVQLVESLLQMMPDPSLDSFFFWNSGAEANEAAIKIARTKTGRTNIIVMQGGYHGGSTQGSRPDDRPNQRCCLSDQVQDLVYQRIRSDAGESPKVFD